MKKLLLFTVLIFSTTILFAQDDNEDKPKWKTTGKLSFLMNQSGFSNWEPGGDNSFSGNININYDFNYSKNGWIWDNKFIGALGISAVEDEDTKKTDDRLELNSILARNMTKNWSFSLFANFKTQFINGYEYTDDDDFPGDESLFPISGFFKPAYLSFGPGYFWKKSDDLSVNFAPITSKFTFINGTIYEWDEDELKFYSNDEREMFGVPVGEDMLYEFGLNIRAYYRTVLMENISIENILTFYSDYLDKPQNMDVDYTLNLVMKINDFFSTNFTFQAVYDDNSFSGLQMREAFGLAVSYNF